MRILVICQYYYPEQFRINDICETLVKEGNEVTVLTGLPNYPTGKVPKEYKFFRKRKETINGVNIIRTFEIGRKKGIIFRMLNYFSFSFSAKIKALFIKKDFDIVFVYQLSPVLMAMPGISYKKRSKTKLVLYCLDLWPDSIKTFGINENSKIYRIIDKISKKIYEKCDKILVTSKMFKPDFEKYNPIYLPQYAEEIFNYKKHKKDNIINLVFAGNIGKAQSIDTIIKSANELRNYDIKFHIVGDGSYLEESKQLVKDFDLDNIVFYGRKNLEEMQKFYDFADAMLVTLSKDEFASKTLPGKVQTCMATANPIIAAADGETRNVINDAKCGYCAPAEDYKELAKLIKKFSELTGKDQEQLGKNGYNFYKSNFTKKQFMNKLINILKEEINKDV